LVPKVIALDYVKSYDASVPKFSIRIKGPFQTLCARMAIGQLPG